MSIFPIEIKNLSKAFYNHLVLDGVNLEVKENEIFGFIGLNGMGKTTFIKVLIDLLKHNEGEARIFAINKILPEARKHIAYLPEKFQPSNQIKGIEFLKFALGFHHKKLDLNKARNLALDLDLKPEALDMRISQYSKGMTQKLGLVATFLSEAKLIILDEPMSGLDPRARIALKKQLIAYKNAGNSIFFSSHILSDIDEICDKIAILNNSKIVFNGSPIEFKEQHNEQSLEKAFLNEIGLDNGL